MKLKWHDHMVSLPMVEKWLKDTFGSQYLGMLSLPDGLKIGLDFSVSQAQKDSIQVYWDGLDAQSDEAQNYRGKEWFPAEKDRIKVELIGKSWDQMSAVEQKIVIGLEVTPLELLGE